MLFTNHYLLPAVPSSVYHSSPPESPYKVPTKICRHIPSKSVRFTDDAKQHDGICKENFIFEHLLNCYFLKRVQISEIDVLRLTGVHQQRLSRLHEQFLELVERLEEGAENQVVATSTPVLPRGGGKCRKLNRSHLPFVLVLAKVVEAALKRVKNADERTQRENSKMSDD